MRQRHNLMPPDGALFATAQLLVSQDLERLDAVAPLLDQVEQQLYLESVQEPRATQVPYLSHKLA